MSINELYILLDLNQDNKTKILKDVASKMNLGYFFIDSYDGYCYLFDKNGNLDDINKVDTIKEKYVKKDIKKIVIPDSVESIGDDAFYKCENLTSIKIPDSVKDIGFEAFAFCQNLKSIMIPDSIESIGEYAFFNCQNLISINIPNSVESIGDEAFAYCESLTSINILDSIKHIGDYAFAHCKSLTSIIIPDSIENVESNAFYDCESLKSMAFKGKTIDQVKSITYYPFGLEDESIIKCELNNVNKNNNKRRMKMKKKTIDKTVNEETFKSFNKIDLSKIKGSVSQIFTDNFAKFADCKTYEDVVALCHDLLDNAGLDTNWTRQFFYNLDQIKARNPNSRRAFEQALIYMNNARQSGMGLGMGRGSRHFYEDDNIEKTNESKKKYSKKQIMEAIEYWKKQLKAGNYKRT